MAYAFLFDASSCKGCKACQVACKDKNNLPLGVLWRRVYEVCGGEWVQFGKAWINTVFAYHLSLTCNHCTHPKCAGVCPTDAFDVRPDGIVLINKKKCIGCSYCAWACPYDAPQVDQSTWVMTKCKKCYDNLDTDLPPACVSACPMRYLELVEVNNPNIEDKGLALWKTPGREDPFPLPKISRTEPHLVVKPHPGMNQGGEIAHLNNREETSPGIPRPAAIREIPLVFFTRLAKMTIGLFVTIFLIDLLLENKLIALRLTILPLLVAGATIIVALSGSFFHLGNPANTRRALNHLRKS
jgi:anaerobic dimethyl sulfoxide reductase subunit B (iron-sulfur subunit)